MNDQHKITGKSKKDGSPWWSDKNEEWQRYRCGVDHGDGRQCSVSIPTKTGKKR